MGNKANFIPNGSIYTEHLSDELYNMLASAGGNSVRNLLSNYQEIKGIVVDVVATGPCTASGTYTLDTVALQAGMTVLRAGETTTTNNGLFIVRAGAWERSSQEIYGGMLVGVRNGTNAGGVWSCSSPSGIAQAGVSSIIFVPLLTTPAGTSTEIQYRNLTTGKFAALAEFFMNVATKTLNGFKALFSSDIGDTLTATTTSNTTASAAIVANATSATGVKVIAKVPLDIVGTGISTMTASGALQYTFDMSLTSSQADSHVVRMLNTTSDALRAHGLYLSGNGHTDSRGLTSVGAQITKLLWVNGRLQLNSRYEESASTALHDYAIADRNSIEFKGIAGTQTLTGIAAGADGQLVVLHGKCSFTIAHNNTNSSVGCRIDTIRGGNLTCDANGFFAMLRYNSRRSMWEVITWHRFAVGVTQSQTTVATGGAGTTYNAATQNYINANAVQLNNARADIANIIAALQQHRIL